MRFTTRDLLWLMALAGLAVGWWIDHRHFAGYAVTNEELRSSLRGALTHVDVIQTALERDGYKIEWSEAVITPSTQAKIVPPSSATLSAP